VTPKGRRRGRLIPAFIACFYAGVAVGWWVHAEAGRDDPGATIVGDGAPKATTGEGARPEEAVRLKADTTATPIAPTTEVADVPRMAADPIADLRRHGLKLPVDAAEVDEMEGDFAERRGGGSRGHEAVDILAPRHTPVRAVEDGTIAKLFFSKAGGITLYQFDPSGRYCYYYAHLERYADGVKEGMRVEKGDVIGYVGTSGNAPPNTPHLHFAIYQLTDAKRWWEGRPVDPYQVYRQ
jgi:peptidoglycan LD-endopeptidase LytH